MAQFNAFNFLRNKATVKTTVRTDDGISTTLDGLPKAYTAHGLATLAEKQEKVRVSLQAVEVTEGVKAKSRATLDGKNAAAFVRGICGAETEESTPSAENAA